MNAAYTEARTTRPVLLAVTMGFLLLSPAAGQKKKIEAPEAPKISPEVEAERKRFLDGLRSATPVPMPSRTGNPNADTTPSGGLVELDLHTGTTRMRTSHIDIGPVQGAEGLVMPQTGKLPEGHGDGLEGGQAKAEGKSGGAGPQPGTMAATPPSPYLYPYSYPWNTTYKLLMRFGSNYRVCSAASASSFHLISAGHCIYNHALGGWASEVWAWAAQTDVVEPRYVEDYPYGVSKVTLNTTYTAWINSADFNWDFAFLTLDRRMGDHTGWMGRETSCGGSLNFNGYPTEDPYIPWQNAYFQYPGYDAGNVTYCNGNRIGLSAYIYGGHSGGPEWRFDGTNRWIEAVNSTSDRSGRAEGTRYTSAIHNDLNATINNDRAVRPPVDRPDMIEYVFNTTSKALLNTSATIGSTFGTRYNTFNAGFADSGSVYVDFYLTRSSTFSTYDYYLATRTDPSLGAYTYQVSTNYLTVTNQVPPGSYYLGYVMRSANAQASTDNDKVVISNQLLTVSCPADSWESDNSSGAASLLTPGVAQYHAICPSTDQDWARFTLNQTSGVTLSTDGTSGDTILYLYNSSLGLIASDDDGGNGYFSLITRSCATDPLAAGTYYAKVVSYGGSSSVPRYSLNLSTSTCPAPPLSSITVPSALIGGAAGTGRVTLAAAAGPGGVTVALASSNAAASAPSTVNVAAGATYADFAIATRAVTAATTVTFTATLNGVAKTDTLVVNPPALRSVSVAPSAVYGGTAATGTVTLTGIAPTGGAVIALTKSLASTTIPATVTVPAGAATATFAIGTAPVRADTAATFTGTFAGVSKTGTLNVRAPVLTSVSITPASVNGGTPSTGTLTLDSPAPTGGLAVNLSSSTTAAATVPATATIPAGATTVNFNVTSKPVLANVTVTVSAVRGSITRTDTLIVKAPTVVSIALAPTSVRGGAANSIATVTISGPAPSGFVLTLSSSNTAAATVPATASVGTGSTTRSFTVTSKAVAANTTTSIRATYGTTYKAATLTITP